MDADGSLPPGREGDGVQVGPPRSRETLGPPAGMRAKLKWMAPRADELLWKKLNLNRALLEDLKPKDLKDGKIAEAPVGDRKAGLQRCETLLDEAQACLVERRRSWLYGRNSDMFWAAIHQADEELILLMGQEQLAVAAIDVRNDFERSVSDSALRASWLRTTIPAVIAELEKPSAPALEEPQLRRYRHLVRGALHQLNDKTDREFWRLAMNTRVRVWSAVGFLGIMLVVLLCSSPLFGILRGEAGGAFQKIFGMLGLFGLGAASAILSNMLYGQKINVPYGPTQTWWAVFYYLVVVPLVGAASGALLAGLTRSELLVSLRAGSGRPVVIGVDPAARPFAYMIITAMGGFLGDRALRGAFEKVYEAMFREADKDSRTPGQGSAQPGGQGPSQAEDQTTP